MMVQLPQAAANPKPWVLDEILDQPYAPARILLHKERVEKKGLKRDGYDAVVQAIIDAAPPAEKPALQKQAQIAADGIADPATLKLQKVTLNTEAQRLMWGATLNFLSDNKAQFGPTTQHPVWDKVESSQWAQLELIKNSGHLYKSVGDKNAMVKWGKPGSWFYFSPEQNLVNIDLMQSLITPDYLRIFLHEEGHRLYTLGMPQRMLDERAEILRLKEESKTRDHTTKAVYIPQASALNVSLVSEILRRTAGNVPVFIERS